MGNLVGFTKSIRTGLQCGVYTLCSLLGIRGGLVDCKYFCQIDSSDPCSKLGNNVDLVTSTFKEADAAILLLVRNLRTRCRAKGRQVIYPPLLPDIWACLKEGQG